MKLTKADKAAIQNGDSLYLVNKGIKYFYDQDYEVAIDYLHLSVAMGNEKAAGHLGYCYLYGLGVPEEVDIALSYFRIGMDNRDIDTFYKVGKLYCDGDVLEEDHELGVYYYENAYAELIDNYSVQDRLNYPDLFYALSKEKLPGGGLGENIRTSYEFLLTAEAGYKLAIQDGAYHFEDTLKEVEEKMTDDIYKEVRKEVEDEFEEEYLLN